MVGGWGEIEIKAKLRPAKAGAWAELGKIVMMIAGKRLMTLENMIS